MKTKYLESKSTTIKLVYMATLIAISFIGSLIKIQGSIALDSMPGFFAALFLGPVPGAIVGSFGHLLTALTSGFPLTLPLHLIVALEMAVAIYIFGVAYEKYNGIIAAIIGILLNGLGAVLVLAPITKYFGLPLSGIAFISAMVIPLSLASAVNIVLALMIYKIISKGQFR